MIKKALVFVFATFVINNSFAGPFVAGGNGVMSLVYCSTENGDFGVDVKKDFNGKLFGYSWTSDDNYSQISPVKLSHAKNPGALNEKPMIFQGNDFKIKVYLGNLPAETGTPIYRGAEVLIKRGNELQIKNLECAFFGIDSI